MKLQCSVTKGPKPRQRTEIFSLDQFLAFNEHFVRYESERSAESHSIEQTTAAFNPPVENYEGSSGGITPSVEDPNEVRYGYVISSRFRSLIQGMSTPMIFSIHHSTSENEFGNVVKN